VTTYSRRDRERAIEALTLCASDRAEGRHTCTWDVLGRFPRPRADVLADTAFLSLPARSFGDYVYCYLEAAALLRDGWNPGDPVVPLTPPKRARGRGRGAP
jgi:hypothetical protein